MKGFFNKYSKYIAGLALFITATNVNIACTFVVHQPELPEGAERFRKVR